MEQPTNQPGAQQMLLAKKLLMLDNRVKSGTGAFFWIAGLSVINTISFLAGSDTTFVIGLGLTQFIDGLTQFIDGLAQGMAEGVGSPSGSIITTFAILLDIAVAGIFVLLGIFGRKRHANVVLLGMVLYFMDALIFVWVQDWFAILFHGFMLLSLWNGYRAIGELQKLEGDVATQGLASMGNIIPQAAPQPSVDGKTKARNLGLVALILLVPLGIFLVMVFLSILPLQ